MFTKHKNDTGGSLRIIPKNNRNRAAYFSSIQMLGRKIINLPGQA